MCPECSLGDKGGNDEADCWLAKKKIKKNRLEVDSDGNNADPFSWQLKGMGFFKPNNKWWGDMQLIPTERQNYCGIKKAN